MSVFLASVNVVVGGAGGVVLPEYLGNVRKAALNA